MLTIWFRGLTIFMIFVLILYIVYIYNTLCCSRYGQTSHTLVYDMHWSMIQFDFTYTYSICLVVGMGIISFSTIATVRCTVPFYTATISSITITYGVVYTICSTHSACKVPLPYMQHNTEGTYQLTGTEDHNLYHRHSQQD